MCGLAESAKPTALIAAHQGAKFRILECSEALAYTRCPTFAAGVGPYSRLLVEAPDRTGEQPAQLGSDGLHLLVATNEGGVEAHSPQHRRQHLHQRGDVGVDGEF